MKAFARILLYIVAAIVALPVIYVVGVYAVVLGGYAVVALGALIAGLFAMFPTSTDDLAAFVGLGSMALFTLIVSAAAIFGIWRGSRGLISSVRNRRAGPS